MLFSPAFIIFCLAFSVGKCQFFYNYEEPEAVDSPNAESPLYQYNSPSDVNQQDTKRRETTQDEIQRTSSVGSGSDSSESTADSDTQRPKKRLYRRIVRQGNYVEPNPQLSPKTYAPSVFENIGLGQPPSGVYIPQDSFLNVLRNNQQTYPRNNPQTYPRNNPQTYPRNNPQTYPRNDVPSVYFQNNAPEQRFFVQPPSTMVNRPEITPAIQPSVQYVPSSVAISSGASPENHNSGEDVVVHRNEQSSRPRRQRQRARPSSRPEPVVDIDVLRTPPDIMRPITAVPLQNQRTNQGRSVSRNRQRQTLMIQDYPDVIRPPRTYSPSVFQNIGLGEAPQGVDIPADSLLNVLRNPSANSRTSPRIVSETPQLSSQPQEQEDYSQLAAPEQSSHTPSDSRRRSSNRSRSSNRTVRRRTEYQYQDETQESRQTVPVASQEQRGQRSRNTEATRSRGYAAENQSTRRQQHAESQQSQNADRQPKYRPAKLAIAALPEDTDDDGIPGEAGTDHPTFHTIPRTTFSCREQNHNGYYADLETSCQVVHLCQAGGVKNSFLCPNGTIFSQEKFSCQWWYKVNCADSPKFYSINDSLYKIPEDKRQKAKE